MSAVPVVVIGGGPWGVGLACAASRNAPTYLVSRSAPRSAVPAALKIVKDLDVIRDARLVILAVPSQFVLNVARSAGDYLTGAHYVVHGVRGLVGDDLRTVSDLVRSETPVHRVGALGGPILVDDLLAGKPSVIVSGARFPEVNDAVRSALGSALIRVYDTHDLLGLEWASALVGALAIAVGFAEALSASPGLIAALICRAMGEAARIAATAGGDERTLLGLAGYGDLLASIAQDERPEVRLGKALAEGRSMSEARAFAKERIEAIELVPRMVAWATARNVNAPILAALAGALSGKTKPSDILAQLMTLPIRERA
jgi:glycerol-3-phosphate dehydrogenase (NAD(P)+)